MTLHPKSNRDSLQFNPPCETFFYSAFLILNLAIRHSQRLQEQGQKHLIIHSRSTPSTPFIRLPKEFTGFPGWISGTYRSSFGLFFPDSKQWSTKTKPPNSRRRFWAVLYFGVMNPLWPLTLPSPSSSPHTENHQSHPQTHHHICPAARR